MASKDWILDPQEIDTTQVVADLEAIRRYNRQRDAMEQLTAIVYDDPERNICIGYRDTSPEEFWVAGHMPGMPLMPGVMMCEAAAQVCSFHACRHDLLGGEVVVGLGGLNNVRFRETVLPGDRLTIVTQIIKLRRGRMVVSRFQEFVDTRLVCEGEIRAIPLPVEELRDNC
ncbi:MAG: beta-hydroxyacyl-ACP dehydratase [Planctomycetes bacterium]|nr:beta-hydroxyacyl-ACP dehydratase [Planctomycetota bacterium]